MIDDIMDREVWQPEKNSRGQDEMDQKKKTTDGRHTSRTSYNLADNYKKIAISTVSASCPNAFM